MRKKHSTYIHHLLCQQWGDKNLGECIENSRKYTLPTRIGKQFLAEKTAYLFFRINLPL
ncbi:hypothetical protein [Proteus hauseri]|uniref:hypothetical protein n=1 Tax=Proteus hauseri TaxID=183417 RepID=UPI0032DB9469